MAERKESSFTGRELGGVALFTLSIFPVVLVAIALAKGGAGEAAGTAALARGLIESVGYWPTLFCGVGFAAVGAALLLSSRELELGRHLSGALFGAIGLAVILGAFHDEPTGLLHGGDFGAATGGALRSAIGAWAGALVGGAILFLAVWLAWLGGSIALPARKNPESVATLSEALTEKDTDGVSAAEATALVPDASTLAYMEELWRRTAASSTQTVPVPPSPYPDDVRLQGYVPDGAAPLPTSDESTATSGEAETPAAGGLGAPTEPAADLGAGPDLAGTGEADGGALGSHPGADPFGGEAQELSLSPEAARALAGSPADPPAPAHPHIPEGARPLITEDAGSVSGGGPPVPVWEASPEPEASATSLVRHAPEEDDVEAEAEVDEAELDEESELEESDEEGEEEEYEYEEEDPEAAEYEEEEDEEEDDESEESGEYEDEEEYEEEEEDDEVAAEYEEDEEDEEDEGEAAELDDEDEEAELDDGEEWEEEADEEAAELDEPPKELVEAEEQVEVATVSTAEPVAVESGADAVSAAEPEVVLQPQPAPEGAPERTRLVFDAGVLFLQQGRVAVSLLQRRFGLEFDEACEVLDELQEVGLIGPYRGGQKRDILLSPEEWETRAEAL